MSTKDSPYFEPTHTRRNSRKSKEIKINCILCQTDTGSDGMSATLGMMPHLKELVNYKKAQRADREDEPPMDYLIIDLRQSKNGGLLPKSHQVDFNKPCEETINYLINDFIELQQQYHFVFMTSNFNSWVFKESTEIKNLKAKKGSSLKSERSSFKGTKILKIDHEYK